MKLCMKCLRELQCVKTGFTVRYGDAHCYRGDKFICPGCGLEVVLCIDLPFHNAADWPEDEFLQMPE